MNRNLYKLWVVLLVVSGGIALWFSSVAAAQFWMFSRLNAQTPAVILKWEIKDLSASRFAIAAEYQYEVGGTAYQSKTIFDSSWFFNRFAAENHVKVLEGRRWSAWYRETSPSLSSLEREFPQQDCLQALLTVGVFAYFYFARSLFGTVRK